MSKKIQKIKKQHYGFNSSEKGTGQAKSDTKKKSYRSDPFQPDPEKEIPKKLQRNAKN